VVERLDQGVSLAVHPGWAERMRVLAHMFKGERADGERKLRELVELKKAVPNLPSTSISWACASIGDLDAAFSWMDRALEERDSTIPFVHIYTEFLAPHMTRDPRYKDLLLRLNLIF
jgi:hypothetical protein